MVAMINLEELGNRICIIGCSSSGKSTLANALAKKLEIPVFHLDQYAHIANSNWQRQSDEILIENHQKIIAQDKWIIDGNYSICMSERLDRATSVIWLDPNTISCVWRYLLRALKNDVSRPGRLRGAKNEFSFKMLKFITYNYPNNRRKYQKLIESKTNLLVVKFRSMNLLKTYYQRWNIGDNYEHYI
jgi:adenylate kinase family enzyme